MQNNQSDKQNIELSDNANTLIYQEKKITENCKDKDVIMFLGRAQVGKSTAINALLGVPFKYDDDNMVVPVDNAKLIEPIASLKIGNASTSVFPFLYVKEGCNYCFVDAPSFEDASKDKNLISETLILMEKVIHNAKSVRLVYIMNFMELIGGIQTFQRIEKNIKNIFPTKDVPLYILFNQYKLKDNSVTMSYEKDKEEQQKFILEQIKKLSEKIIADNINNEYLSIFKNSIEKGFYGYIDPTQKEYSVDVTLQHFEEIKEKTTIN